MAKQDVKTNTQERQENKGEQLTRGSQSGAMTHPMARLSPFDMLAMNPFALMRRMTEEMDRAFANPSGGGNGDPILWTPAIEVKQQDGKYVVRAELPGLKPEEVKVEVVGDSLVIEGERKYEREEDKGGVHRSEIHYGRFYRGIPLPEGAHVEQASAKFENGVLEIAVPVQEQAEDRRQIPVASATSQTGSAGSSGKAA